jgi:sugar phosphate isomerase/epimerase
MANKITRRQALMTGAVSAGLPLGAGCTRKVDLPISTASSTTSSRFSERVWWSPGGNPDYVRDLTPGNTAVRLACMSGTTSINYPADGDITGLIRRIREAGYTAANGHSGSGRRNPWLDASESEISELKQALETYDVDFYDMMVWTNLIHPDTAIRDKNIQYVIEAFEAAERCGVRSITGITGSMAPGDYNMHTLMHPDNFTKEAWKLSVESIRRILDATAGYKVVWGMEQCITTAIDSPEATRQIIEDVDNPRCKCVLDVTNMISLNTLYRSSELIDEVFDLLGEDVVGAHAKDFRLENRMLVDLQEVPPGQGILDYETYLVRLSRMSWPRTLMLEHFAADNYPPSKRYIEETASRVGVGIYS